MDAKNLLVVDDDEAFCGYVEVLLTPKGYQVATETDARKAMLLLQHHTFDIVLLDLVMPELNGLDLLTRIREHFNVLPILVVSAHGSAETTLEAMRRGATDFITKPVDASHLDLRIQAACSLERARRRAKTDGLTGLYNHRYLHERLGQEIERVERYGRHLSLVMADLDHFKTYNDTFGHPRGDELLIAVSKTLRHVSRASDVVARYGGDELTMMLPETSLQEAERMAERARACVEALDLESDDEAAVRTTLSLGVASLSVACRTKEDLIESADGALYEAKRLGKNRVCVARPAPGDVAIPLPGTAAYVVS